jgi:hypothetical protein
MAFRIARKLRMPFLCILETSQAEAHPTALTIEPSDMMIVSQSTRLNPRGLQSGSAAADTARAHSMNVSEKADILRLDALATVRLRNLWGEHAAENQWIP